MHDKTVNLILTQMTSPTSTATAPRFPEIRTWSTSLVNLSNASSFEMMVLSLLTES